MGENSKNLNIKFTKSKEKIAIKPIIKLETDPEILKNLKEVFSSQKIKDQIKSAVNKLQADDALNSPNSTSVIRPQKIKTKQKPQLNSVKESLRTSILHKTANNQILNKVKTYSSSHNYKSYSETIKVPDIKNIRSLSPNNGVIKNLDTHLNENSNKMLNENNLSRNTSYNQPIILNSRAYMASNNTLNNKIKLNPEPLENSQYPIQVNILNGKIPMNYEFSISGNNDISFDSSKNNKEYILKLSNSGTRKVQTFYESATESECDTVQFKCNNVQDNSHNSLKKKLLPATVTTNHFSNTSTNQNDQPLNLISNHSTINLINNKRKSYEEKNFTLCDGTEEHEPKPHGNRRKKIHLTNVDRNKISRKTSKIINNELIVAGTNNIFKEDNKSNLLLNLNPSKISSVAPPEIKIQKAAINIEGIQTNNYKADILEKRFLDSESPKKIETPNIPNYVEISKENKTIMAINFIKKALEKNALFKSPENPPKNKIDDVNFQNEFLMNEIEEYKNLNKDYIKTEENFCPQNQPIGFQFTNYSPERNDSGCSPKLIQDLDSNTIFKQKSAGYSPKINQNFCSNAILNNNLDDSLHLVNPTNTYHKPIEETSKEFNDLTFKNENAVDAVDFLCSLNKNFEKYGCDDDDEDDISESSFNIDDSEILRPEDFLQNISKSLLNEKNYEDKNSNENTLQLNNVNIKNSIIGTEDANKLNNRSLSKSMPIVIENKILAEDEKINLNLCLGNSVQLESIKNIVIFVDKCNTSVTESKNPNVKIKIEENLNNVNQPLELVNNNFENKLQSTISLAELENERTKILEEQNNLHTGIPENVEDFLKVEIDDEINLEHSITEFNKEVYIEPKTNAIIMENKINQNNLKPNESTKIHPTLLELENTNKIQHNNAIDKKIFRKNIIASHELPLIEEEIIKTTDSSINTNLPLIDASHELPLIEEEIIKRTDSSINTNLPLIDASHELPLIEEEIIKRTDTTINTNLSLIDASHELSLIEEEIIKTTDSSINTNLPLVDGSEELPLIKEEIIKITDSSINTNLPLIDGSHELPLIEEEITKTIDKRINTNLPLIDISKNLKQNNKPKTVQISSRRPGLKGSKINLVQRRKGQTITNKNNLSKKPENEENPSISPHLLQNNLESTEKKLDKNFQKNENLVEQIVDANENFSKETQHPENESKLSKTDHQVKDNYNSINCLDNVNVIENQLFFEKNNDLHNKNLEHVKTKTYENEEVFISTIDNSNYVNSSDLNRNNLTEISLSDNNVNIDALQTNSEEDVSNESDLSKSEFNGFDLSCNENSMQTMYNTFEEITSKIKELQTESCSTISEYNIQAAINDDHCNSNIRTNDGNLVISKDENLIEKDINNVIEKDSEHLLKTKISGSLSESVENKRSSNNLTQSSENMVHSYTTLEFRNNGSNSNSFDAENPNRSRKISSSKDLIKKRQKTFTSDSDSFGEDDCVPLKKRPLRNPFSNNSVSESEQTRKENKIMILEKRAYFSTRKDSETSTSSDHHYSIPGFNSPNIDILEKPLENNINDLEGNKKIQISITECFGNSEIKNNKNSLELCLETVKVNVPKELEKNHNKYDDNKKSENKVENFKLNLNLDNKKNWVESCLKLKKNSQDLESINDLHEKEQINSIAIVETKSTKNEHFNSEDFKCKRPFSKVEQLNYIDSESKDLLTKNNLKKSELSKIKKKGNKKINLNLTGSESKKLSNEEKQLNGKLFETSSKYFNQVTPLKSDNSGKKIKKTSKSSKILSNEQKKKDKNESEILETTSNDILHEDFNKSLINNTLLHFSSTPISKAKKRKTEKNTKDDEIDKSLKKKKKTSCIDSTINDTSSGRKVASIDNQMTEDSFVNGLPHNHPILGKNSIINEVVKDASAEQKKRGRKKSDLKSKNNTSLIPETNIKKDSAFEKFCKTLIPDERKKGKKISSSAQRKLHPNILLINKRCDIETFKFDDSDIKPPNENEIVCGLCKQIVLKKSTEWTNHLSTHYGIGWIEGKENIDVTQYNLVLSLMINFIKVTNIKALKCRMCGSEFKSALGVLTHLLICGLKEEDKRNETHIICEYCNKPFHFVSLKLHMKMCSIIKQNQEQQDSNSYEKESEEVVFSNSGRYKRKSTVKAENKLKEIGNEFDQIDVKKYIKTILPIVRGGIYRKWKKNIESGEKVKCCGNDCEEIFDDINLLKKHVNSCNKIEKTTYRCLLCKFIDLSIENVKKHVLNQHQNILKNISMDKSGSEVDYSKEDRSESSEDCSSGVDENDISNEQEDEDIVVSDEEQSKIKKRKRVLNSVKNILQSTPKFKNSFLSSRNSFAKVAERAENWTKFFITNNYSIEPLFTSCLAKFELPTDINRSDYEPQNDISMKFSFSKTEVNPEFGSSTSSTEKMELERLKWIQNKNELLLYIGGPITTVQWVPLPDTISRNIQYLAISYKCNYNKFTRVINQKPHKTLILIFKLESSTKEFCPFSNVDSSLVQCKFQYGIICDNGPIHDMKFLPSGGYDTSINRLGLVAVANVDNNVNIYSLPIEAPQKNCDTLNDNDNINLIRLKPVMKLTLSYGIEGNDKIKKKKDHYFTQCHKIVWSKTKGHNMLGTGYANGCVALWNIDSECNLNCIKSDHDETLHFTPISYFRISDKYITSLDFHYDHKEPRWLIAASYSRTVRIFDIENPSSPIVLLDDLAKSFVTTVNWPLVWENSICASSSDLCLAGPLTYSSMQFFFLRRRCAVIPSGVTSLDFNPWTNVCIIGTENGDFTFEFRSEYNLDCTLKRYLLTKSFTYTDLIKLDGSMHPLVEENNVPNKKQNNKINKNKDIETSEKRVENIEPLKFFDKDYRNKYGLVFGPLSFHKELGNNYQSEKRCPQFNLSCYVRINTVACNTNYHGSNFNAIGYENGFIRIFYNKLPKILS